MRGTQRATAVSRHLESLERWLGARLLHRATRRVSLSAAGEEALPRLRQMLESAADLQAVAGVGRSEATGKRRVPTSLSFALSVPTQALVDFQSRQPRIEVDLLTVDRAVDLVSERIDLAVRITNKLDDGVVACRPATCRSVLCAAPGYLSTRGTPATPAELLAHNCITHAFGTRAEYQPGHAGRVLTQALRGSLSGKETAVVKQAAIAGAGIAMLPTYFAGDELQRGTLVRVLPACEPETLGIHAVVMSWQHQPLPMKLLVDFLSERFGGKLAPRDSPI